MLNEISSEKNCTLFVIDEYKFRFHKNSKNNVDRYCCTKKNCAAYIHLNNNVIIKKVLNHENHKKDSHSNMFVFIDILKNKQKDTYITLRSTHLNTGRTNIFEKEKCIRNVMKLLELLEEIQIDKIE